MDTSWKDYSSREMMRWNTNPNTGLLEIQFKKKPTFIDRARSVLSTVNTLAKKYKPATKLQALT
jgi:hypothetical protein